MFCHIINLKIILKFQCMPRRLCNHLYRFLYKCMPLAIEKARTCFLNGAETIIPEFCKCSWGCMETIGCIYYSSRKWLINPETLPHFKILCRVQMESFSLPHHPWIFWAFMICIVFCITFGAFAPYSQGLCTNLLGSYLPWQITCGCAFLYQLLHFPPQILP